ncbi:hypothetical protein [Burkholderia seminalis]|uniref:hypothetical protein n=1 Tax=Burkholderia seminalis TaxID=488731 RepID=UPI0015831C0A|nr:hypothetical protein [Burkholderia seminalis]MCA8428551.1 hypothetical protein [Burkholderia seminalis]
MARSANGTGSPHDGLATGDLRTHESFVVASEHARSRSGRARACMSFACPSLRAESHYVVNGSGLSGTDARMHTNGAGHAQTFLELWNSLSGSLAGAFRIACRNRGLEGLFEFGGGREPVRQAARTGRIERHSSRNPALTRCNQRISFNP